MCTRLDRNGSTYMPVRPEELLPFPLIVNNLRHSYSPLYTVSRVILIGRSCSLYVYVMNGNLFGVGLPVLRNTWRCSAQTHRFTVKTLPFFWVKTKENWTTFMQTTCHGSRRVHGKKKCKKLILNIISAWSGSDEIIAHSTQCREMQGKSQRAGTAMSLLDKERARVYNSCFHFIRSTQMRRHGQLINTARKHAINNNIANNWRDWCERGEKALNETQNSSRSALLRRRWLAQTTMTTTFSAY